MTTDERIAEIEADLSKSKFYGTLSVLDNVEYLLALVKRQREDIQCMVNKAADQHLNGYRELGMRAANAENERDDFQTRNNILIKENAALKARLRPVEECYEKFKHMGQQYGLINILWQVIQKAGEE